MNTGELLDELHTVLSSVYPTGRAFQRYGRIACVLVPSDGQWEQSMCEPWPLTVTIEVHILAAAADEQGAKDLPHHIGPVCDLIRSSQFIPIGWRAGSSEDTPAIVITATANGTNG